MERRIAENVGKCQSVDQSDRLQRLPKRLASIVGSVELGGVVPHQRAEKSHLLMSNIEPGQTVVGGKQT